MRHCSCIAAAGSQKCTSQEGNAVQLKTVLQMKAADGVFMGTQACLLAGFGEQAAHALLPQSAEDIQPQQRRLAKLQTVSLL